MAFWLNNFEISFPHPKLADPDGLLAVGGDLRPERLWLAYSNGIFPWYQADDAYAWFSPDPRCVLAPLENLKVQKSMRSIFNQKKFRYTVDNQFLVVIRQCAEVLRNGQEGSWIDDSFVQSYLRLHELGYAHSVEVWREEKLVGGLYGIAVGRVFCGESMFSLEPNASKAGFITLVRALQQAGFWMVDCQVETPHLLSLGAHNVPRDYFLEIVARNKFNQTPVGKWALAEDGSLVFPQRGETVFDF